MKMTVLTAMSLIDQNNYCLAIIWLYISGRTEIHLLKFLNCSNDYFRWTVVNLFFQLADIERLDRIREQAIVESITNLLPKIFSIHDEINCRVSKFGMCAQFVRGKEHRQTLAGA